MMGHTPLSPVGSMLPEPLVGRGDMTPENTGSRASEGSHPTLWGSVSPSETGECRPLVSGLTSEMKARSTPGVLVSGDYPFPFAKPPQGLQRTRVAPSCLRGPLPNLLFPTWLFLLKKVDSAGEGAEVRGRRHPAWSLRKSGHPTVPPPLAWKPGQSPHVRQILHPSSWGLCRCLGQGLQGAANLLLDRYNFWVLRTKRFL